jgi:hypothetical protein
MGEQSGFRRAVGLGLGLTIIGAALAAAALASGCSGDVSDADDAVRTVPSEEVLCQVYEEYAPDGAGLHLYGSLGSDVIAALGEPTTRTDDVWTYEWCVGETCTRKAGLTITLAEQSLCMQGKPISGLFVAEIDASGLGDLECWQPDKRKGVATCDGCIAEMQVGKCVRF